MAGDLYCGSQQLFEELLICISHLQVSHDVLINNFHQQTKVKTCSPKRLYRLNKYYKFIYMSNQATYNLLCFTEQPFPLDNSEEGLIKVTNKINFQLKSNLAKLSENLSYFDQQGKKINAKKLQQSKQKIQNLDKTSSVCFRKSIQTAGYVRPLSRERPASSKKQKTMRHTANFFRSEQMSAQVPLMTIKKMQPIRNQALDLRRLQITRQRSKRLLSLNIIKKNKKKKQMRLYQTSTEIKFQAKNLSEVKSNEVLKPQTGKNSLSKWSQSSMRPHKYRKISVFMDRKVSEQYQSNIMKSISILQRCHDILTTIQIKT